MYVFIIDVHNEHQMQQAKHTITMICRTARDPLKSVKYTVLMPNRAAT